MFTIFFFHETLLYQLTGFTLEESELKFIFDSLDQAAEQAVKLAAA